MTFASLEISPYFVPVPSSYAALQRSKGASTAAADMADDLSSLPGAAPPPPDEVALLVQINPAFATAAAVERELRAFVVFLQAHKPVQLVAPTVLLVQENALAGNGAQADAKTYIAPGFATQRETISDALCEVTFELSPTSFFQVSFHLCLNGSMQRTGDLHYGRRNIATAV